MSPSAPRMGLKNFIWTQWCFRNPGNRERRRPRVRRPAANSPLLGRALHISAGAVFRNINRHMVRYIIITLTITSVPLDRSPFQLLAQALPWQPFGTLALAGATDSDESSIMKRVVDNEEGCRDLPPGPDNIGVPLRIRRTEHGKKANGLLSKSRPLC